MITKLSHATIWVKDQNAALEFYRDKLGFEVKTDATMGDFRWLTVGPRGQDLELVLMPAAPNPMMDAETLELLHKLIEKGAMGAGVFATDDCRKTFEELSKKGVEFRQEPMEKPYGIDAILVDNSGNWFSLTQHIERG
jgi:predicted enzyme related to lactoylglutathione lyase